jgi:ThiD2 family/Clp amino terminal domain, pathogenicity island component
MHHAPHPLTAASQRAIDWAWANAAHIDEGRLLEPALLAGLLRESECRAATMLGDQGVSLEALLEQWPELSRFPEAHSAVDSPSGGDAPRGETPGGETPLVLRLVLTAAREKLDPLAAGLATEHLLWGLARAGQDASTWLAERGVTAAAIEEALDRWYGTSSAAPLDFPADEDAHEPVDVPPATERIADLDPGPLIPPSALPAAGAETIVSVAVREPSLELLRIVDAAGNRAREAIRVLEDYARFALDDRHLTRECKHLRHALVAALAEFSEVDRLAARDALADVGPSVSGHSELPRGAIVDVLAANAHRVQEALRSLEEYTKLLRPDVARALEPLRYRSYTLQRALVTTLQANRRWADVQLCVLLDGRASLVEFERLVGGLLVAGVPAFQLRDKRCWPAQGPCEPKLRRSAPSAS